MQIAKLLRTSSKHTYFGYINSETSKNSTVKTHSNTHITKEQSENTKMFNEMIITHQGPKVY